MEIEARGLDGAALDPRKAAILRAIVEQHIATAQPVGSQAVARAGGLGVSSATVRNEMTILERDGYITAPHTSAGRIPTDRGYRYFVDHFTAGNGLRADQRRAVVDFFSLFASAHRVLEDVLHETSHLLARVSAHTAVVVGPPVESETIRTIQLVRLQPTVLLVLAVLSNGHVERCLLEVDGTATDAVVRDAAAVLDRQLAGVAWAHVPNVNDTGLAPVIAALARQAGDVLAARGAHETPDPLYVGGASWLAAEQEAFSSARSAARLLELLEHQREVVAVLHQVLDGGPTVRIGSENAMDELRDCSIVVAPFHVEGEVAGTVGVLGPTRMDYSRALAAVDAVARQLGTVLS